MRLQTSGGYILAPVLVLLALVGLVAYVANQSTAVRLGVAENAFLLDRGQAVAESGMAHARWSLARTGCPASSVLTGAFGGHSYSVTAAPNIYGTTRLVTTVTLSTGGTVSQAADFTCVPYAGAPVLFWTDNDTRRVRTAAMDGSNSRNLPLTGLEKPDVLKSDPVGMRLYWIDENADSKPVILSSKPDGSDKRTVLVCDGCSLEAIALAPQTGRIFWIDDTRIRSSTLTGGNLTTVIWDAGSPRDLAIDDVAKDLYWISDSDGGRLMRSRLNGSNQSTVFSNLGGPQSLSIDPAGAMAYWYNDDDRRIWRRSLSGGGFSQQVVYCGSSSNVRRLALDMTGSSIYWTDSSYGRIRRAAVDGSSSSPADILSGLGGGVRGIAIGPSQ